MIPSAGVHSGICERCNFKMSLKNFIDRMRKRILVRRAQMQPRSKGKLRVTKLEDRKLLDAGFGVGVAGILTLDGFDGGDALSFEGDLTSGGGSFTLESGIWNAANMAPAFAISNDGHTLNVNSPVNGVNINADEALAGVNSIGNGLQVASLEIVGGGNVSLDSANNDFDSLSISADSLTVTDIDDLVLHDVTVSPDIMVQAGDDLFFDGNVTSTSDTADVVLNAGSYDTLSVADDADVQFVDASLDPADVESLTELSEPEITEVVFVDSRVADSQTLVDGLRDGVEIVFLDADSDGLQQIADYTATHDGLDAIHIVSHGSAGQLYLGSTILNDASLGDHAEALTTIGDSLTDAGDLLLYGCNVAEGIDGAEFIQHLAAATGADVAASVDVTGADFLGGDWDLEFSDGTIEAGIAFGQPTIGSYSSVLGVPTASFALNSPAVNQGGASSFTVTFSEPVNGVDGSDFSIAVTGSIAFSHHVSSGGPGNTEYSVTAFNVTGEGTLQLQFGSAATALSVADSQALVDLTPTATYTIDSVGPTAAFTASGTNPTTSSSVTFDVDFHEAVTGVDAADFASSLSGVTADAVVTVGDAGDVDASTYQVTVTNIAGGGTVNLDFASGATITDTIGNAVNTTPTADDTYTVDTVLPTVQSIARVTAEDTNADSVDFTVTFAEDVTGVGTGDFAIDAAAGITGATVSGVSGSGSTYTVTVNSVDGDGSLSIDFDADADGGVTDLIGNISTADFASGEAYAIDNTPPGVPLVTSFSDDNGASASDNITNDDTLTINGSAEADSTVEIFDGMTSLGTTTANGSDSWTFTTSALANGSHSLTAISTDAAGNASSASTALSVTTDTQAPTVDSIVRSAAAAEATQAASVDFTVTFVEGVNGVTAADFVLSQVGGVDAAITGVTAVSATESTVTVNTGSGGTIGLHFDADADMTGGVTDIAGNDATADFTTGETYAASSSVVSQDINGHVSFSDVGNASSDNLTIVVNGSNLRISDPTSGLLAGTGFTQVDSNTIEIALADITTSQLTFTTGGGADTLTIDFSAGYFTNNIVFNGGGPTTSPGDVLVINGGTFSSITKGFTSSSSGYVFLGSSTIGYNELEPVLLNVGSVAHLIFELPASNNDVILEDDGIAANGMSQIRSGNGSFETTTFTSPTGSLTIHGNGGAFNDTFTVDSLPDFAAAATLNITSNGGTGTDTVNFNGTASVAALTINVTGAIADGGSADVTVANNASFTGDSVNLGDAYNFGSLTFSSAGNVNISEADEMTINSASMAASATLTSTGGIGGSGLITATNLSLAAGASGVGTLAKSLTFNATTLNATTTGSGSLFLSEVDSVTIDATGLNAGNGTIELDGGTFVLGGSNRISNTSNLTIDGGATLDMATNNASINQLQLIDGTITGTGTLTGTNTFLVEKGLVSANLAGAVGLGKSSAETVTLSGTNTYSVDTGISQGTLLVNGSTASASTVRVSSGATLGGTGTVAGDVLVLAGGTITGGTVGTVGSLTVGSLSLDDSTYHADIDGDDSDTIISAGTIDLKASMQGILAVNAAGTTTAGTSFKLIDNTSASTALVNPQLSDGVGTIAEGDSATVNGKAALYSYIGGDGGNDLTLTTTGSMVFTGTGADDDITLQKVVIGGTDYLQVFIGATLAEQRILSTITDVTINGGDGSDTLTLDYSTAAISGLDVTFNGDAPTSGTGDSLIINGGSFDSATYNMTGTGAGNVVFAGGSGNQTISFTGLEPVTVTSSLSTVVINVDALHVGTGTNVVEVLDSGTAGMTTVTASATGATFESITFSNPTALLQINGEDGAGVDVADQVTITSLGSGFAAALDVDGQGGTDVITVTTNLNLGNGAVSGNLDLTAEAIQLNSASINTDGGTNSGHVLLTGNVELGTNVSIDTDGTGIDANITFSSGVDADSAAANRSLTLTAGAADISVVGTIGSTEELQQVQVVSAGNVTFSDTINTSGNVIQTAVSGMTTFNGTSNDGIGGLLTVTAKDIVFNTATVTTVGAVTLNADDDITLNAGLNASAASITIHSNTVGADASGFVQTAGIVRTTNGSATAIEITVGGTGSAAIADVRASSGTVSITASGGAITDNLAGEAANISASKVALTALSGIGTADNINTAVTNLEAKTATGGIFIANTGAMTIGSVNGNLAGVDVTGASGEIVVSSTGTITVAEGVSGPANVTLSATGATSDVAVNAVVNSTGGDLILTADRDVNVSSTGGLTAVGANKIDVTAARSILVAATVQTVSGDLTLFANQQPVATSGNFAGITLSGTSLVQTTSGNIDLRGKGGDTGNGNYGIYVLGNSSMVQSTGAGAVGFVHLTGAGGAGVNSNDGVYLSAGIIRSLDGAVDVTGTSSGTGTENNGVHSDFGQIISEDGGSATITIHGTGAAGTNFNSGVRIVDNASVTSRNGAVDITGVGQGSGSNNQGVDLDVGGQVVSRDGGTATITIDGTGAAGASSNVGVRINSANSAVTSQNGAIDITGHGGAGSDDFNRGVEIQSGGQIISRDLGTATITINGTGGSGTSDNQGVLITGTNSAVTAEGGAIDITGTGGAGSGARNIGVSVSPGGKVVSRDGGTATITIDGTGGSGSNLSHGVLIDGAGAEVTAEGGSIQITGTGGGTGGVNDGIRLDNGSEVESRTGGSAPITMTGTAGVGGTGIWNRIGDITSVGTGDITLVGDSQTYSGGLASINAGTSTVAIRQLTNTVQINLGGADAAGVLGIDNFELNAITAGTLIIGDASSGDINVSSAINVADNTIAVPVLKLVTGGAITGSGSLTADTLMLTSVNGIGTTGSPLHTVASTITASNATSGDIAISNTGSLALGTGGSGITNSAAGGAIQIAVIGSGNDLVVAETVGGSGTIELTAADELRFEQATGTTGVITTGAAALGSVTLSSGNAIVGNANSATDVNSVRLDISAVSGIGSTDVLETIVSDLNITNSTGNVQFQNTKATGITISGNGGSGLVSLKETAGSIEVDSVLSAGSLTLDAAGNILDGASGSLTVAGLSTLIANDITLDNVANNFNSVALTAANAILTDADSIQIATSTVTNTLNVTALSTGDISQTGSITGNMVATFTAAGNDITLSSSGNDFNSIALTAATAKIQDANSIVMATSVVTTSLEVTALNNGSITQSGNITGDMAATFSAAGGNVTLNNLANDFASVILVADDASVQDVDDVLLGTSIISNTFTVTAGSNINSDGSATVTATTVDLNAATGIGDTATVNLLASAITADTTAGNVFLKNALATVVTLNSLTTGSGSVSFEQSDGGTLTASTVSASTSATLTNSAAAIALNGSFIADSLRVDASGTVTDGTDGDLDITNNADFTGTSITLGNDAGNTTSFGSLTFNSIGAVVVQEDSATALAGTNTALSLDLDSTDTITDGSTSVAITNLADFNGTAINVGGAGTTTNFGTLTFNSAGSVVIQEDSSTALGGVNTALSLDLDSTDAITDGSASVAITNLADFNGTAITVGGAGTITNFGTLTFNSAGAVVIQEDSSTALAGDNTALTLDLDSAAVITDGSISVAVTNLADFNGTAITVGGAGSTTNFGTLTFNSAGAVVIQEDSSTALARDNTALSLDLDSTDAITDESTSVAIMNLADFNGTAISVGGSGTTTNFATLTFNSAGAVVIQEDSATALSGTNTALSLDLDSAAAITDGSISVAVTNLADFSGTAITVGGAGTTTNFGTLMFNSAGVVIITEDSGTELVNTNTASNLTLNSAGNVTSTGTTTVDTTSAITTNTGSINGAGLITAATIDLNAGSGIGNAIAVQTVTSSISADTTSNNINIDNLLATATTVTSLTTGNGSIVFDQTGGGDVTFSGAMTSGNPANGGAITLKSANGLNITGSVSSLAGGGGTLNISGATINGSVTAGAGDVTIQGGSIDLIIGAALNAGDVLLSAKRDVIVSEVVTSTSSITVTSDTAADAVGGVRITAAGQLNAAGTVSATGSDLFATAGDVDSILIDADGTNVQVLAGGNISLGDTINAPAGSATVVNGRIETTGALATIGITAEGNVEFGADGDVAGLGGDITITADTATGTSDGQVVMADGAQVTATTGTITVSADGNISVGQLSNATTVNVTSDSGAITDAGNAHADIITANAALNAATGIGDDANALEINTAVGASTLTLAAATASGDIHANNTGSLTVGDVGGTSGVTIVDPTNANNAVDNITLTAASPFTVSSAVVNNAGGDITLAAQGNLATDILTINAGITATGGDGGIHLFAGFDIAHNTAVVSAVGAGNVLLSAGEDFNNGTNQNGNATADVIQAEAASVVVDAGDITVRATDNVTIGSLTGTTGTITVSADFAGVGGGLSDGTGAINDNAGNTAADLTADTIDLNAGSGIGNSDELELASAILISADTTTGNIDIDHSADAATTASSITTGMGTIDIDQAGNQSLALTNVSTANGDITITNTGGNAASIAVDTIAADTTNDVVSLTSFAAITDGSGAETANITASEAALNATSGVGTDAEDIDTVVGTIAAVTESGAIYISDVDAVTIGTVGTLSGLTITDATADDSLGDNITVVAGGQLTVAQAITNNDGGNIALTANGGTGDILVQADVSITGSDATLNTNGNISLTSDAAITMDDGTTISTNSGLVDVTAVNDITVSAISTPSGEVRIDTTTGAVIDGGDSDIDITAASAAIQAATGIGATDALETAISNLAFDNSDSGLVNISNTGNLTISNVNGVASSQNNNADAKLTVNGDLDIAEDIALGTGNLLLSVTGNVTQQAGDDITAAGLALMVGGTTTLQNAGNDVTTFAANNDGETLYTDANGLTVGTIIVGGMPITGITTSGDNVKLTTGGDLMITQAVAVGAGSLFLAVIGDVTQTAAISGTDLALMVSGTTTLTSVGNAFTTLAANNGGTTRYTDADALNVGAVTVDGMTVTGITTSDDDVRLTTGSDLNINETVAVGGGNLLLDITGNVAQTAAITGTGLALNVTGTTILTNTGNDFTTIATNNGDNTEYVDATAVEVGSVTADGSTTTGITSTNDDVTLCATSITLATGVAIGTGTLRLSATTGSITQTGGTIVAQELGAKAATGIDLSSAGNDVDEFAADGGTGSITLVDGDGYTIGEVTTAGCFSTTVTGVTTGGDFESCVTTGDIMVTSAINATGTVRLEATAGNVTQTASGVITADALGARANGSITLNLAANDTNTFAAESSTGNIAFNDANAVTIDTVTAGTCFAQVIGVTTTGGNGNINVSAATDLTVMDAAAANGSGSVTLNADAGTFESNAHISSATGNVDIDGDVVSQNANITTAGGGTISVTADNGSITMAAGTQTMSAAGDITVEATADTTLSQLTTDTGNIDVDAAAGTADLNELISSNSGTIDITADVVNQDANITTAGAGTIDVTADNGSVTMADGTTSSTATGAISYHATTDIAISELNSTAGPVNVTATTGNITDNRSGEDAGSENVLGTTATLTANGNIGGADDIDTAIDILDASSITVGSIDIAETDAINLTDVDTANGAINVVAGGQITATDVASTTDSDANDISLTSIGAGIEVVSVNAGTGAAADVTLDAQNGNITNSGANPNLVADNLNATASGSITLDTTIYTVTAASTTAGDITLNETDAVTLHSVTTVDGAIAVTAGADIVATSVDANGSTNDNVLLTATTGDVTATSVAAADSVTIDAVAGSVRDTSVTAETGDIDIDAQLDVTVTNVTATAGHIDITADTGDVLVDRISANGASPTVTILATVGSVLDSNNDAAVNITAANGNVVITAGTDIGEAGTSVLKNSATNPLEVDSAIMNLTATGIIAVHQTTATVVNTLNASPAGTIFLSSDSDIDLSASTPTATNLSLLTPTGTITLPNPVNMITGDLRIEAADVAAAGGIDLTATRLLLKSGQTEEITIHGTGGGPIEFDGQSTNAAAGDLTVNVDTDITLTDLDCDEFALDVGSNIAVINATGVTVDQADQTAQPTFDSKIRSGSLVLNGTGTYQLANTLNDTDILAGNNSGTITYRDIDDITIDTVSTPANGSIAGLTSGISDVLLDIGTTLTINQQLNAGTGDVRILANGDVTQTATGIITANELGVQQNSMASGQIQLAFNNAIDEVAASNAFSGGMISVQSTRSLMVGTVDAAADAGVTFGQTIGLVTSNGDITVESDMALTLNDVVDSGTADVRLIAQGNITQDANGTISADELGVRQESATAGTITLDDGNDVNTLAAFNANPAGTIAFNDVDDLTIDNVSGKTIGGITFAATDGVLSTDGDILLNSNNAEAVGTSLTINRQLNAGIADIRIVADGTITQSVTGTITANELGIRQAGAAGDINLGAAPNDVDFIAADNVAVGGDVTFFDADDLTVAEISNQQISNLTFATTTGINANAGNINITSEDDFTVNENINAAHDTLTTSIDESITLISRNGDFTLADNTIITSDENPAPGVFDDITGDKITIIAGSSGSNGTVSLGDNIEVRTDGGVAKQVAPRPTAFATPGTVNDAAFVTLADAENMRSNLTFVPEGFLGVLNLEFGVAGEENLEVVVDWGAVSQTSLTASGPAGGASASTGTPGALEFSVADADKTVFYIDEGGEQYLIPHIYSVGDLATTGGDRNGRETNPSIFGVRFSVAQHASINIWGTDATDPAGTLDTPPGDFQGTSPTLTDATGTPINPAATSLALLSSTDTNNLNDFNQEAAQLPLANDNVTTTGRPVGLAEWEFIAGPSIGLILIEPTPRPMLEIPKIEARFNPIVVSKVIGNLDFGAGASSDAAIGTEVYLQIRRYFELDAEAEVVISRIADSEFISNRESFEAFVAENLELQDGAGYEVWLITETGGQRVVRPIVKFEITGGRPGPATELLPDTFEPYELKELEFEQPENEVETPAQPQPKEGDTSAVVPDRDDNLADRAVDEQGESSNVAAALLLPTVAFTKAARWKRQQEQSQLHDSLSRSARTVRRMRETP